MKTFWSILGGIGFVALVIFVLLIVTIILSTPILAIGLVCLLGLVFIGVLFRLGYTLVRDVILGG